MPGSGEPTILTLGLTLPMTSCDTPDAQALPQLGVLVVDCQATAAAPNGHLLEIGWARLGATAADARAHLIALPAGARVPPAVARITGITDRLLRDAVEPELAWRALAEHAAQL